MEAAVKYLVYIVLFFLGLCGPVWGQSAPDVTTPRPQGWGSALDDPQPEPCRWYVIDGERYCLTPSDLEQMLAPRPNAPRSAQVADGDYDAASSQMDIQLGQVLDGARTRLEGSEFFCSVFAMRKRDMAEETNRNYPGLTCKVVP